MVLCVKAKLPDAEKVKASLRENGRFLEGYRYDKDESFIYFPVTQEFDSDFDIAFVERALNQAPKKEGLKETLKDVLSDEERELFKTSVDQVGSIDIIVVETIGTTHR